MLGFRKCGQGEDTSLYVLCEYDALAGLRVDRRFWVSQGYPEKVEIKEVEPEALLHFCQSAEKIGLTKNTR